MLILLNHRGEYVGWKVVGELGGGGILGIRRAGWFVVGVRAGRGLD